MAAVEVVSATSAFQAGPIKTASPPAAADLTPEEPVKEAENVAAEPANKPEAEALAAEVEAKVVVLNVNQEGHVGAEIAKVAPEPEPEPAAEETITKEAEPETKVDNEEAEPADTKPAAEVEEEKVGDEVKAEAAVEKSDE